MVRTKQTARKQHESEMQRALYPTTVSESEDSSDSLNQMEDTESGEDTGPKVGAVHNETELEEVERATSTSQPLRSQIVLPQHTAMSSMDSSFINYFREHGMTPYLMESLTTKRGWTLQMVNRVIRNCNSALKTNVAPDQSLRYTDEVDTDEELGPLPHTRDNANVAATTVTSQTLYTEGETSAQTGLPVRVEAVTKKGRRWGASMSIARKEPRNFKKG